MSRIAALVRDIWNGHIPLARIFWEYAIGYGTVLNLLATFAAFGAFSRQWSEAIGLAIFFLPAPYNLLMIVGVWRSAAIYQGPAIWPMLARALIIAWAAAATFI